MPAAFDRQAAMNAAFNIMGNTEQRTKENLTGTTSGDNTPLSLRLLSVLTWPQGPHHQLPRFLQALFASA